MKAELQYKGIETKKNKDWIAVIKNEISNRRGEKEWAT